MKVSVCVILILLVSSIGGIAQNTFNSDHFKTGSLASQLKTIDIKYSDVKGSPYANLNFIKGSVSPKKSEVIENISLRFNIYTDRFEILGKDSIVYEFTPLAGIHWVGVNKQKYVYHHYFSGKKHENSYFRIDVEGVVSLLVKEKRSYHFEEAAKAMIPAKPARFVDMPNEYYFFIDSKLPIRFKKVSELLELIPDRHKEVEEFIKKNKLKKAKLENYIEIIEFYNSL